MNALTINPSVIKNETLVLVNLGDRTNHVAVEGIGPGVGALFLGSELDEFRAARAVECWNLFTGVESPIAEMERLRALDLRHQQLADFRPRPRPLDPGTGPWVVVDQFPAPLLYLGHDGFYAGLLDEAREFTDWEEVLDEAELLQAYVVPVSEVRR